MSMRFCCTVMQLCYSWVMEDQTVEKIKEAKRLALEKKGDGIWFSNEDVISIANLFDELYE